MRDSKERCAEIFGVAISTPKGVLAMFRGIKCRIATELLKASSNVKLKIKLSAPVCSYEMQIGALIHGEGGNRMKFGKTDRGFILENKRQGYNNHFVRCTMSITDLDIKKIIYIAPDGKSHGHFPRWIMPRLFLKWGKLNEAINKFGYEPYWSVFEDIKTGRLTFGNYTQYSKSERKDERERAERMEIVESLDTLNLK